MNIYSAELIIVNGGSFLARPHTVGTCVEELDDLRNGRLNDQRSRQIMDVMTYCAECLRIAEPWGRC